jgi:hypothetical protein
MLADPPGFNDYAMAFSGTSCCRCTNKYCFTPICTNRNLAHCGKAPSASEAGIISGISSAYSCPCHLSVHLPAAITLRHQSASAPNASPSTKPSPRGDAPRGVLYARPERRPMCVRTAYGEKGPSAILRMTASYGDLFLM